MNFIVFNASKTTFKWLLAKLHSTSAQLEHFAIQHRLFFCASSFILVEDEFSCSLRNKSNYAETHRCTSSDEFGFGFGLGLNIRKKHSFRTINKNWKMQERIEGIKQKREMKTFTFYSNEWVSATRENEKSSFMLVRLVVWCMLKMFPDADLLPTIVSIVFAMRKSDNSPQIMN